MIIEIMYLVPLVVLGIVAFAVYFNQLNWFTGLIGAGTGFAIAYYSADYTNLIITSVSNSIWYGYSWGWIEMLGLVHIITLFIMMAIAINNLWLSNGKKLWG